MPNQQHADMDNPLLLLSSIYQSLTKTEKKIADTIMKEPDRAVYATVTDMAEMTSAGETSVLRLCRKLGFRSYQEFKLSIAKEIAQPKAEQSWDGVMEENDDWGAVARKVTFENRAALENTMAMLDLEQLAKSIDVIVKSHKITFFGINASGNAALDGKYRFLRMGLNVDAVTDSHVMAMTATLMKEGDAIIGISTSGSTKDLVDAVRIAKSKGVTVICITSQSRSPLAQFADMVLLINSRETPLQGGAFSSKISQIHVLDILSTAVTMQLKESANQAIEKTARAVADKLY